MKRRNWMEMENPRGCEKIQCVATWVGMSVASAFFASLERFACINLATTDDPDDNDDEAFDNPLMLAQATLNHHTSIHAV